MVRLVLEERLLDEEHAVVPRELDHEVLGTLKHELPAQVRQTDDVRLTDLDHATLTFSERLTNHWAQTCVLDRRAKPGLPLNRV